MRRFVIRFSHPNVEDIEGVQFSDKQVCIQAIASIQHDSYKAYTTVEELMIDIRSYQSALMLTPTLDWIDGD